MTNPLARTRPAKPTRKRMMETRYDTVGPQKRAMVAQWEAATGFNQTKRQGA